jgi:autotransporter adhesin
MVSNSNGSSNVALGYMSLITNTSGNNNTALGRGANVSSGGFSNATALGYNATASASNKLRLGSSSVNVVEGQVAYTTPSDARFKRDVRADVKGLAFILALRPVSYTFDRLAFAKYINEDVKGREQELAALSGKRTVGFLAQEVEKTVEKTGFADFDAVHVPENANDNYGLAYGEFVVPLVQAVQELHAENEALKAENARIQEELDTRIAALENALSVERSAKGQESFRVFPDPANEIVHLEVESAVIGKPATVTLIDGAGKRILVQTIPALTAVNDLQIPSSVPAGTYIVELRIAGAEARTTRVVIHH